MLQIAGRKITEIAELNPRLAAVLVTGRHKGPKSYQVRTTFDTGAPGTRLSALFAEKFYHPAWVMSAYYAVERPEYMVGSAFKAQSDYYNGRIPYIDVRMEIQGADPMVICEGMGPIQNKLGYDCPRDLMDSGWVFWEDSNLRVESVLTRALAEGETPYKLCMTFNVLEISGCCSYVNLGDCEAKEILTRHGYPIGQECGT